MATLEYREARALNMANMMEQQTEGLQQTLKSTHTPMKPGSLGTET